MHTPRFILWTLLVALFLGSSLGSGGQQEIEVFAGSASKPALEEIARAFQAKTGTQVLLHFGGSGALLSQMALAKRGDIYFPGSSDFMEIARNRGLVDPTTEVRVAYLLPTISVARGNPRQIRDLADLARPGLRVGLARPESVCVGLYGVEALERRRLTEAVRKNVVTYAESCEKTAQLVSLGLVDAALGWDVFDKWDPTRIETVYLRPGDVSRIGYLPAAVSRFPRNRPAAVAFLSYLGSAEGKAVFRAKGYLVDVDEARRFALPAASVGGTWALPTGWGKTP